MTFFWVSFFQLIPLIIDSHKLLRKSFLPSSCNILYTFASSSRPAYSTGVPLFSDTNTMFPSWFTAKRKPSNVWSKGNKESDLRISNSLSCRYISFLNIIITGLPVSLSPSDRCEIDTSLGSNQPWEWGKWGMEREDKDDCIFRALSEQGATTKPCQYLRKQWKPQWTSQILGFKTLLGLSHLISIDNSHFTNEEMIFKISNLPTVTQPVGTKMKL